MVKLTGTNLIKTWIDTRVEAAVIAALLPRVTVIIKLALVVFRDAEFRRRQPWTLSWPWN